MNSSYTSQQSANKEPIVLEVSWMSRNCRLANGSNSTGSMMLIVVFMLIIMVADAREMMSIKLQECGLA